MSARGKVAIGLLAALGGLAVRADEPVPTPADFRLKEALFGVGETPMETAQLLAHDGKLYQFRADTKEAVVVDPAGAKIDLIDFAAERRVRTTVTFAKLDEAVEKLRQNVVHSAERREKEGGKANLVAARMTRSLIESKLAAEFDAPRGRLRLAGESAQVEATGTVEPDAPRGSLLETGLTALAKLDWIRTPEGLPPFIRLQTLTALMRERRLRPTELVFIYRLAGPPQKLRWTYELVPKLADSELEAIARIDALKPKVSYLSFARYERLGDH